MARSWTGGIASGSRQYEPADVARVLEALPRGRGQAVSLRTFSEMLGMDGRTVRAILSDRDGLDFLMVYDGDLMWDAEWHEEARAHTEQLRGRALTELGRVGRRERYAATLPRRQGVLLP